jgi:L-threonylcarbamoyladenylate synthase
MRSQTKRTAIKETVVLKVNSRKPQQNAIERAAKLIRSGHIVAFPTETVYGLGANGLDNTAVAKIFVAKGRPQDNPLILHVGYKKDISKYAVGITPTVKKLIRAFWPGPLTIILRKGKNIPSRVTAGLPTVAIRMPAHSIALKLIRSAGVPLAAPSANVSGKPSPTRVEHVIDDLEGKIPLILDGGRTNIGIESTVLDCTLKPPMILRPGKISAKQIEAVIGTTLSLAGERFTRQLCGKSPGMKYRHYAPVAPMILVVGDSPDVRRKIRELAQKYKEKGKRVGILSFGKTNIYSDAQNIFPVYLGRRSREISKKLFDTFRIFDRQGVDIILCEMYSGTMEAIHNRLIKAAGVLISAGSTEYSSE